MHTVLWTYLGWRRFPRELTSFEARRFFTFSASDRREIRVRYARRLRLGAAIQLGFVRLTGTTLDAFDYVPRAVLDLVGRQLELPAPQLATLRAIYRRERTLFAHQAWACAYAGFRWPAPADLEGLDASLIAFADVSVERPRLARHAREYLYSHGCLISRARDIDRRVRRAVLAVEATDVQRVEALADAQLRATWIPRLLREMEPGPLTVLEWLRRAPKKRSPTTLRDAVSKLHALRSLWPVTGRLTIPAGRLRVYAQRMARRRPAKLREITEPRRTLEIASLLCSLVSGQSDIVLQLIEMRINALWSRAQAHVEADPLPAVPDAIALELFRAMADESISDADYRARARQLLVPWGEAAQQARSSRAAKVRAKLVKNWRRLRALLKLVLPLKLCAQSGDEMAIAFRELETCYAHGWTDLWTEATTPSGRAWQTLIQSPDREQAFKAYEAATLWGLRRGLRSGALWLPEAHRYGGRHRVLLPERAWQAGREAFLARRGLPSTAEPFIARTVDQIRSGLAALVAAQSAQELEVMPAGYVYMKDDPMWLSERGDAEATRARLYESLGRVQLPELLIAVDSETHFTWELLGRAPSAPEELTPVYAAILVAAMGLDRSEAAVMIPGVRSSAIRRASFLLEEEHALRQANEKVLCALLGQPLAKHWGDGYEASSDLMSLDVSRHVWLARVDPKRRRHAVGTYTHVLNQWGIVYDQPLLLATRQAGAAIEGAIRQSVTRLERLAVDTHGYTDFGMAVAKTLGFDLCPQLYSMRDRHLHVPRGFPIPAELAAIAHADVSLEAIVEGWDEFLRVVASIEQGWRTATEVLERFGSSARGDPAHRAGHALGQLIRTAYLCDYFTLPEFRRSVHQILSRGESVHALQRQICARALPAHRGRRIEELISTSGALSLVSNCVMAWNTMKLQRAMERMTDLPAAQMIAALREIGPVGFRHINFRGTYRFPVERYAERLLATAA
jgi:TnpA family transposase